mmetsp:Transcript_149643/g.363459  ORF Transcript_149643/g.363459 Transcript_149643/m.363459 type:complete len:96 (-) Transcript_149643:778-1065(-)
MQNFERNSQILQFKSIEFSLPGVMIVDFLKTRNVSSSYIGKLARSEYLKKLCSCLPLARKKKTAFCCIVFVSFIHQRMNISVLCPSKLCQSGNLS